MLMIVLFAFVVLALAGGGWGYSRYGAAGMSPAAVLLVIVGVLYFTGHLNLR